MNVSCILPTTGQDWANHIAKELDGNGLICFCMLLNGQPDTKLLRLAVNDTLRLQPVLRTRFDDTQDPPVWSPLPPDTAFFDVVETENFQTALTAFAGESMGGRQLFVRLALSETQSALLVKMDHSATDGGGAKAYLKLLNSLYNSRFDGKPLPESISLDRGDEQVFSARGVREFRQILAAKKPSVGRMVPLPYQGTSGTTPCYALHSVSQKEIRGIKNATVNDALVAALAQALPGEEGERQIHITIDLRRYLNAENAPVACNLSGIEGVMLKISSEDTYEAVLQKASEAMAVIKESKPGLYSAASMAYLRTMPYAYARALLLDAGRKARESGMAAPLLSNLGRLYDGVLHFGKVPVTGILPLTPALHAPAFMLGASGYGDTVTLCAGFFKEERDQEDVKAFLRRVGNVLSGE